MRILIVARRHDPHLDAVAWGLGKLGIEPSIWYWEDFPRCDLASFSIGCDGSAAASLQLEKGEPQGGFDVVWLRRMGKSSGMPNAHPDDVATITSASEHFVRALLPYLGHANTRWVNEYYANDACENKLRQLAQARENGFRIPDTLISNAPDSVRAFFDKHEGRIIHKSFAPAVWNNADGSRTVAGTASVSGEQLRSDYAIQACPGIYQQKIEKKHELRVTVMGDSAVASAIHSQRDGPTTDWRSEGGKGVTNLRAIAISPELERQCVDYCRKLGLAFGCIDLIVTPDDGIVFLEINRWGQFLFNEISDSEIPMLDAFCRFLAFGHARPRAGQPPAISMAEYFKTSECLAAHEARMAAKKAA